MQLGIASWSLRRLPAGRELLIPEGVQVVVDVPPVATIVGALLGGALLASWGPLLGIPLAAALLLLAREVVLPRQERL